MIRIDFAQLMSPPQTTSSEYSDNEISLTVEEKCELITLAQVSFLKGYGSTLIDCNVP